MHYRNVTVRNKIASCDNKPIVCGNSDYIITFDFDEEWDAFPMKTMVISFCGKYQEVTFTGDLAALPAITNAPRIGIGVYAGDIRTTTVAHFPCCASATSQLGSHDDPPEDVYNQLSQQINGIANGKQDKLTAGQNISIIGNVISSSGGGLTPIAAGLLLDILKAGVYTSDISDEINQLEEELESQEPDVYQIGDTLYINNAPVTQVGDTLYFE